MGNCVSSNNPRQQPDSNRNLEPLASNLNTLTDINSTQNDASINSLDANNSTNNNITSLHQIQSNSEHGSLSNLASIINNSIPFQQNNSNSVFIANTLTNTTTSYYNSNNNNSFSNYIPPTGKNKKLKKDFIKYFKFDKKVTENQLNAKREEFWDTAPAFDGKIEIWSALKAAVEAYEEKNYQLAQAIIDSANIILPKGFLNDCYDELGNRYQIPIYVLAKPINMKKSNSGNDDKDSTCVDDDSMSPKNIKKLSKKIKQKIKYHDVDLEDGEDNEDEDNDDLNMEEVPIPKSRSGFFKNKFKFSKVKNHNISNGSTSLDTKNLKNKQFDSNSQNLNSSEEMFQIKVRVSNLNYNENDLKIKVASHQTVAQLKAQITEITNIEPSRQRLFFGGKLMKEKNKLKDHKLRKNVVVQVITREFDTKLNNQPTIDTQVVESEPCVTKIQE